MFITKWLNTTYHTFSHMLVHTGGARPWLEQAKWEPNRSAWGSVWATEARQWKLNQMACRLNVEV